MAARKPRKAAESPPEAATGPTCQVPDCDKPVHLRGLCAEHWYAGEPADDT